VITSEMLAECAVFNRQVGFDEGVRIADALWQSVLTGCTETWNQPRMDKLRAARAEVITTPCRQKCKRCSRCIRYASWWRNGQRDFPGGKVPAW
jgi:hypothetical protein